MRNWLKGFSKESLGAKHKPGSVLVKARKPERGYRGLWLYLRERKRKFRVRGKKKD